MMMILKILMERGRKKREIKSMMKNPRKMRKRKHLEFKPVVKRACNKVSYPNLLQKKTNLRKHTRLERKLLMTLNRTQILEIWLSSAQRVSPIKSLSAIKSFAILTP